ncbi:MAG: hypothetical protein KF729_34095 [Sandaracinaceae bacterium]|nr:hypothetical protein [Sandaracinaceae bacterium]
MSSDRGVTCSACGATTPLPDDLLVPTFACAFCHGTLSTAAHAGEAAVSADALVGHIERLAADPKAAMANLDESVRSAPRFEGGSREHREGTCVHCRAPVAVPLDLAVRELTCGACGRAQFVREHISDEERFRLDMARQVAGNEAYERLLAEGLACPKCGGHNPVPDDGSVQLICKFCRAAILLSDHVDESAIARHRLKHGVYAVRDELMRQQQGRQRTIGIAVAVIVVVVLGALIAANLLAGGS